MKKIGLHLLIVCVLAVFLVLPFFQNGYFPTHDGEWAVVRLGAMHRAIISGQFPVRWADNLNFSYGYPLFNFTYPLPYYLGEVFNLLGFGLVGSIKILFILSAFLSGIAMFFLARDFFGNIGGLISAVFYLYAPYRLVNLYVRGSLGESLAFLFYPLIFLGISKIAQKKLAWRPLTTLLLAALILTHNVSALIFMPFLIAFMILKIIGNKNHRKLIIDYLLVLLLGVGLTALFLIPALIEKKEIILNQITLADKSKNFVNLRQLLIPGWGYGAVGEADAFSFQLGWVHLLALILAYIFIRPVKIFLSVSLIISILLALPISLVFWQTIPLFTEIDFPWRVLGLIIFFISLNIGSLAKNKISRFFGLILVILVVIVNSKYIRPVSRINYGDDYYLTNEATTTSADELMPVWVKEKPTERPAQIVEIISGNGEIKNLSVKPQKINFLAVTDSSTVIQVNKIYFPGWVARETFRQLKINYQNPKGLIQIYLPDSGNHQIELKFRETPLRLTSDIISLISLVVIVLLLFIK